MCPQNHLEFVGFQLNIFKDLCFDYKNVRVVTDRRMVEQQTRINLFTRDVFQ